MGEQRRVFGKPVPLDPLEDLSGRTRDFIVREMGPAGENATEENGRVHGRYFGIENSFPRIDVDPVEEKSPMVRLPVQKGAKRKRNAVARVSVIDVTAFLPDADGGETEPGGGDAGEHVLSARTDAGAIPGQTGKRTGLFPEEKKIGIFQIVEKAIVIR